MIRGAFEVVISEDAALSILETLVSQPAEEAPRSVLADSLRPILAGLAPVLVGALVGALSKKPQATKPTTIQDFQNFDKAVEEMLEAHRAQGAHTPRTPQPIPPIDPKHVVRRGDAPAKPYPGEPDNA